MRHRPLGRTGIRVSPCCLGAMMSGKTGNPDHHDSIQSALTDPMPAGKARAIGSSAFPASAIVEAQRGAGLRRRPSIERAAA